MRLRVKDMDIATGGPLIAVLNETDALKLDLHPEDRILLKSPRRECVAIVDIGQSKKAAAPGEIGLVEEVLSKLQSKRGDTVRLFPEPKPASVHYIKKKLEGKKLTTDEINTIVLDLVNDRLSSIEITYFVAASYTNGLDMDETRDLTLAIAYTGDKLNLGAKRVFDKHSIGGVAGNRTTMVLVPIVAAAGLIIPKTSSRSITSPAGTADTMEVLCKVAFPLERMKKIVEKTNGCIVWGGALNLAPADDRIIKVENPLSVDAEGQLLASILAKKKSVGATDVLVDIPVGAGSKVEKRTDALKLKREFETLARKVGVRLRVILTDGRQPVGNGCGPKLEARDVLWVLLNEKRAPCDLREKALMMSGMLLEMAGKAQRGRGYELARILLDTGAAYKKMMEIIRAQGGKKVDPGKIRLGEYTHVFRAPHDGIIKHLDNTAISKIARAAGAPKDDGAGIYIHAKLRDKVKKGQTVFTIYAESKHKLKYARQMLKLCSDKLVIG